MDKNKVKKEAKEILDKFAKALDKVKIGKVGSSSKDDEGHKNFYVEREYFERVEDKVSSISKDIEEKGEKCDFKDSLLENAPRKDKDFVIAEKGGWR